MSAEVIVLRPLAYDFDSAAERAALDRLIADCHAILALERQGYRCSVAPIQLLAGTAKMALRHLSR